jgi:hypothetical protein
MPYQEAVCHNCLLLDQANLARNLAHPESIELVRAWIKSMPTEPAAGE